MIVDDVSSNECAGIDSLFCPKYHPTRYTPMKYRRSVIRAGLNVGVKGW